MPQSALDTDPEVPVASLVALQWESGDAFYCSWNTPLVLGTETYMPEPRLQVEESALTGGLEEEDWRITAPSSIPPFANASKPYPHEKIEVNIFKVDPRDVNGSKRRLWRGRVVKALGNPNRRRGLVQLVCRGPKSLTEVPLGITATSNCDNIFGNEGGSKCRVDLTPIRRLTTLTGTDPLNPRILRLDPAPLGFTDLATARLRWEAGDVRVGGLSMKIVSVLSISPVAEFLLVRTPPPTWTLGGATIATLTPGCRKTYTGCTYWSNVSNFRGIGITMQNYNPGYENPPGSGGSAPDLTSTPPLF